MAKMPTAKQVQQHIQQLVNQDKQDKKQVDNFYDQALMIIKNSLSAFFVQYAGKTGLDYNTLAQRANSWDKQQFEQAINLMMTDIQPSDDLNKRLMAARFQSQIKHRDALQAIVTATVAIATEKTQNYGNQTAVKQYKKEYAHVTKQPNVSVPKQIVKNDDFNSKVWVNNDIIVQRTNQTIDKAVHKTIDKSLLRDLVKPNHDKVLQNNIDSASQPGISFNKSAIVESSVKSTNSARDTAFSDNKSIDYVTYVTDMDDKVCDICQSYSGTTYAVDDPSKVVPVDDTHPNCRCLLVPSNEDGELLESYNEDEAETANSFI